MTEERCVLAVIAWFMQDEAEKYFSRPVQDVLDNTYHGKGTGITGPVTWFTHSYHFIFHVFICNDTYSPSVFSSN